MPVGRRYKLSTLRCGADGAIELFGIGRLGAHRISIDDEANYVGALSGVEMEA
jgi:hypothetical protein